MFMTVYLVLYFFGYASGVAGPMPDMPSCQHAKEVIQVPTPYC